MMTGAKDSLPEMAHVRLSEGLKVIFDQGPKSDSASPRSRSGSRSSDDSASSTGSSSRRHAHRRRRRSPSSSSLTSNSSVGRCRSRSHPRCHRNSSRCCCSSHRRNGDGRRHRRSPPRRYRPRSRTPATSSRRRGDRSHSRSHVQKTTNKASAPRSRSGISQSPSKTPRMQHSRSRSRSSGCFTSSSLDENKNVIGSAEENVFEILGVVEQLESATPIQDEQRLESRSPTPEPSTWVRLESVPEKPLSQKSDVEPDEDALGTKLSQCYKKKIISFSIHNSVAKPTVAPLMSAKVTSRMDSVESRKPYGHWVPIRPASRRHTLSTSR